MLLFFPEPEGTGRAAKRLSDIQDSPPALLNCQIGIAALRQGSTPSSSR